MAQLVKTFYPYDPLAAAELNQIVSFLNGTAAGTNIEDEAILHRHLAPNSVESGNINFGTLIYGPETVIGSYGGKPVYQKFITANINVIVGVISIPHGIVNLDTMLELSAAISLGGNAQFQILPWVEATQRVGLSYIDTAIVIEASLAWGNNKPFRAYVKYTKA